MSVANTLNKMISSIFICAFEAQSYPSDNWLGTLLIVYPFPGYQVDSAIYLISYTPLNVRFIAWGETFARR